MNREALINKLSYKVDAPSTVVRKVLQALIEVVHEGLKEDGEVVIRGIGTFKVQKSPGRSYTHPQDPSKTVVVGPHNRVVFKASAKIKELVNEGEM